MRLSAGLTQEKIVFALAVLLALGFALALPGFLFLRPEDGMQVSGHHIATAPPKP